LTVGKSTLDIEEALNSRKLVVFNLSKSRLGSDTSEAFGRFIIALVQSAILKRVSQQKGERVPVHMFIDEFQNYVSASMKEVLAESRKYGLHLTLAQQYVGQEMDTAFKDAILTNTQIKMTGLGSNKTVAPIAKEMGLDESEILRLGVG
jgi:type IV secretory pathway TraG/TraD family ATPase VirD4